MAATIADVARAAGVSPGTVSNALNHPERLKESTRQRVQKALNELDFRPNRQARMLAGGKDRGIGLVIHDAANPFFAEIAHSVDDVATEHGYGIILASSRTSAQRQDDALRLFAEHQVSGILLSPTAEVSSFAEQLRSEGTPVVLLDSPGGANECAVSGNDRLGGELAGRHLLEVGCTRLAFIGGPDRVHQHAERLQGLVAAMDTNGLPASSLTRFEVDEDTLECGVDVSEQVANRLDQLDGVFCGNDLLAIGLIRGLQMKGIAVPDALAVMGYDDISLTELVSVPVTTVHQPMHEMGSAAADLLLAEISGGQHRHRRLVFDPTLVVRSSTRAPKE